MSEYFVNGKKHRLKDDDYITEGGEGKIYKVGDLVFKIYEDPSKMIPSAKINELKVLDNENIVRPMDLIYDHKQKIVGFTMKFISSTLPLVKLFSNDFWNNNNVTPETIKSLVEEMIKITEFIHSKNILIVDYNEMNELVDINDYTKPYYIDVNSFQTQNFPAPVIMPNVRDYHAKSFNKMTDWFSFAILSCQLFIGIHPFKGSHPSYKKGDIISRMKSNVSIFGKDIKLPPTVRDFSNIPQNYMDWFVKEFEEGKRIPPPIIGGLLNVIQVKVKVKQSTNNFEITFLQEYSEDVVKHNEYLDMRCVVTRKHIYISKTDYKISTPDIDILYEPKSTKHIFVKIDHSKETLMYMDTSGNVLDALIQCTEKMVINNTLYLRNRGNILEMKVDYINGFKFFVKNTWTTSPNSTQLFEGISVRSIVGKFYLNILEPTPGNLSNCFVIAIPELDKVRVLDAKYQNHVCILTGIKNNIYIKSILRFNKDFSKYESRTIETNSDLDIVNFVVLNNGIVVSIDAEGIVEVYSNKLGDPKINSIKDPDIDSSMKLTKFNNSNDVMFFKGNKLYSLKMKK